VIDKLTAYSSGRGAQSMGEVVMKAIIASALIAAFVVAGSEPSFAKRDCKADISEFDTAVKTTKAGKADVTKATKLRDEAQKDCLGKGGTAMGDADMQQALKLVGAR
jgi:hypothetical protein